MILGVPSTRSTPSRIYHILIPKTIQRHIMRGIIAHCNSSILRIIDDLELGVILSVADRGVGERARDIYRDAVSGFETTQVLGIVW
jgi:hypothetical protein